MLGGVEKDGFQDPRTAATPTKQRKTQQDYTISAKMTMTLGRSQKNNWFQIHAATLLPSLKFDPHWKCLKALDAQKAQEQRNIRNPPLEHDYQQEILLSKYQWTAKGASGKGHVKKNSRIVKECRDKS